MIARRHLLCWNHYYSCLWLLATKINFTCFLQERNSWFCLVIHWKRFFSPVTVLGTDTCDKEISIQIWFLCKQEMSTNAPLHIHFSNSMSAPFLCFRLRQASQPQLQKSCQHCKPEQPCSPCLQNLHKIRRCCSPLMSAITGDHWCKENREIQMRLLAKSFSRFLLIYRYTHI